MYRKCSLEELKKLVCVVESMILGSNHNISGSNFALLLESRELLQQEAKSRGLNYESLLSH